MVCDTVMLIRPFFTGCLILLLAGCVSQGPRERLPDFEVSTLRPVYIRLNDERRAIQRGNRPDAEWIYFQMDGNGQAELFVNYLGNALTALGASPGYIVLGRQDPVPSSGVLIDVDYLDGYSRWPKNVDQQGGAVSVEGKTRIRYDLFTDGRRIREGALDATPDDFRVAVGIITRENVRRVVSEALAYQFDKATTDCLDEFLWKLHGDWGALESPRPAIDIKSRSEPLW